LAFDSQTARIYPDGSPRAPQTAKELANAVIPNEYGIDPAGKLRIGSKICSSLLGKILADLANMREESLATAHIDVRGPDQPSLPLLKSCIGWVLPTLTWLCPEPGRLHASRLHGGLRGLSGAHAHCVKQTVQTGCPCCVVTRWEKGGRKSSQQIRVLFRC
jgi:hypothetical protein